MGSVILDVGPDYDVSVIQDWIDSNPNTPIHNVCFNGTKVLILYTRPV